MVRWLSLAVFACISVGFVLSLSKLTDAVQSEESSIRTTADGSNEEEYRVSCCDHRSKANKPVIFVSTLDGSLSAIDASIDGGGQIWTMRTDEDPLVSSTLDNIPLYDGEREYRLIPSLDGHFYLYNDAAVRDAPFNVDALLSGSLKLGADVLLSGGKQIATYIVNYGTGQLYQTCGPSGCERFSDEPPSFPKLVITRTTQTVRDIDPRSVEERWNVTVVTHELLLDDAEDADSEGYCICLDDNHPPVVDGKEPDHSHNQGAGLEGVDLKIIPPEGVVFAYDKRNPGVLLWKKKLDSPIAQIWTLSSQGKLVERSILDPKLVPALSYFSADGHSAFSVASHVAESHEDRTIYVGTYNNQKYVIRSPQERRKTKNVHTYRKEASRVYLLAPAGQLQIGGSSNYEGSCGLDCPTCTSDEVNALILHKQYPRDMGWYLYKHSPRHGHVPRLEGDSLQTQPTKRSSQQKVVDFLDGLSQSQFSLLVALALGFVFIPTSLVIRFYRRRLQELKALTEANHRQSTVTSSDCQTPTTEVTNVTPTLSHGSSTDFSGRSYGRYSSDFEPIRQLGRGGFGLVLESRNKHDDQLYAVKRIGFAIKKNAKERVRREVKALAQLDHPGVVRYFSAWFEEPPAEWQKEVDREMFQKCWRSKRDNLNLDIQVDDHLSKHDRSNGALDSYGVGGNDEMNGHDATASISTFGSWTAGNRTAKMNYKLWKQDESDESSPTVPYSVSPLPHDSVEIIFAHSSKSELIKRPHRKSSSSKHSSTRSEDDCHNNNNGTASMEDTESAYLYIQMQLCRGTLKEWLIEKNNEEDRDRSIMLDWFDQLTCAMQYVHGLGLVHRDLKPSNIFFSTTGILKIGDFGLATAATLPNVQPDGSLGTKRVVTGDNSVSVSLVANTISPSGGTTDRVGTELYMSPEQELGRKCTAKADIYALGLIFIELLIPCKTVMERVRMLQDIRRYHFPDDFVRNFDQEVTTMGTNLKPKLYSSRKILGPSFDILKEKCDITSWHLDQTVPRDELLKQVERADALYCVGMDKIDEELLDHGKNLKVISTVSVGYDHIDVAACKRRGIKLGHTPDVLTETVAELGMALILCTTRRLLEGNQDVRTGRWGDWYQMYMCGRGIQNSVVGIVGMGRIGASLAEKLKAFHPKELVYHNRNPSKQGEAIGATYIPSLDELLKKSDFVVCLCPLSEKTKHLFNKEKFALMKPTAQFFNVSRGGLVDQDALYDALANKKILAAGLDVSTPEPLPPDHKLLTLPNFVMLPHMGSATVETRIRMATLAAENIVAGLEGKPLPAEISS